MKYYMAGGIIMKIIHGGERDRDSMLIAYACSVLDAPVTEFEKVKKAVADEREKEGFISMMEEDLRSRLSRLL